METEIDTFDDRNSICQIKSDAVLKWEDILQMVISVWWYMCMHSLPVGYSKVTTA